MHLEEKRDASRFLFKRAKAEFPVFLKVMGALPEDLSYKPHDRSRCVEQLAWTITNEIKALKDVVDTGKSEWKNNNREFVKSRPDDAGKTWSSNVVQRIHGDFHALWIDPKDANHASELNLAPANAVDKK